MGVMECLVRLCRLSLVAMVMLVLVSFATPAESFTCPGAKPEVFLLGGRRNLADSRTACRQVGADLVDWHQWSCVVQWLKAEKRDLAIWVNLHDPGYPGNTVAYLATLYGLLSDFTHKERTTACRSDPTPMNDYFGVDAPNHVVPRNYQEAERACASFGTQLPGYNERQRVINYMRDQGYSHSAWLRVLQGDSKAFSTSGDAITVHRRLITVCIVPAPVKQLVRQGGPATFEAAESLCRSTRQGLVPSSRLDLIKIFILWKRLTGSGVWLAEVPGYNTGTAYYTNGSGRALDKVQHKHITICFSNDEFQELKWLQSTGNTNRWFFTPGASLYNSFSNAKALCQSTGASIVNKATADSLIGYATFWEWVVPTRWNAPQVWVENNDASQPPQLISYSSSRFSVPLILPEHSSGRAICTSICTVRDNVVAVNSDRSYRCHSDYYQHSYAAIQCINGKWTTDCRLRQFAPGTQVAKFPNNNTWIIAPVGPDGRRLQTGYYASPIYCKTAVDHQSQLTGQSVDFIRSQAQFWKSGLGPARYWGGNSRTVITQTGTARGFTATPLCRTTCSSKNYDFGRSTLFNDGSYTCRDKYIKAQPDKPASCIGRKLATSCVLSRYTANHNGQQVILSVPHKNGKPLMANTMSEALTQCGQSIVSASCGGPISRLRELIPYWNLLGGDFMPFIHAFDEHGNNRDAFLDERGNVWMANAGHTQPRVIVCAEWKNICSGNTVPSAPVTCPQGPPIATCAAPAT